MTHDLAWGQSRAVREAFLQTYNQSPFILTNKTLNQFDYPDHNGDPELVEITKNILLRQTGAKYKHVFLTVGATGAIIIALGLFKRRGFNECVTRKAPYYVKYPNMISASNMEHSKVCDSSKKQVCLLDLPSNPMGLINVPNNELYRRLILDGVYLNNVYKNIQIPIPTHSVMVGSYSKLLGLNGIRIGWLATNEDLLVPDIEDLVTSHYCGVSTAETILLKDAMLDLDWLRFETLSRYKLDSNRTEWSKLARFFDGNPIPEIGMFHYSHMDTKAKQIFERASILWTKGSLMGSNDDFARFNLGQTNEIIDSAVKSILQTDKI